MGAVLLLSGICAGNANAGLVTLYDPNDTFSLSHATISQNAYTLFQALNDVHLAGLAATYDPGPGNTSPGFYWELWSSDASGNLQNRILLYEGFNPTLGSPDPGLATYETTVDLDLQAGQYYVVGFQSDNNPNAMPYAFTKPSYSTSDGNFQVVSSNDIFGFSTTSPSVVTGQISLDVAPAPEPSTLALLGIGAIAFISFHLRGRDFRVSHSR